MAAPSTPLTHNPVFLYGLKHLMRRPFVDAEASARLYLLMTPVSLILMTGVASMLATLVVGLHIVHAVFSMGAAALLWMLPLTVPVAWGLGPTRKVWTPDLQRDLALTPLAPREIAAGVAGVRLLEYCHVVLIVMGLVLPPWLRGHEMHPWGPSLTFFALVVWDWLNLALFGFATAALSVAALIAAFAWIGRPVLSRAVVMLGVGALWPAVQVGITAALSAPAFARFHDLRALMLGGRPHVLQSLGLPGFETLRAGLEWITSPGLLGILFHLLALLLARWLVRASAPALHRRMVALHAVTRSDA